MSWVMSDIGRTNAVSHNVTTTYSITGDEWRVFSKLFFEYQNKTVNLVGLGYDAFLKLFEVTSPDSKQIYIDVNGRKELRHVYEFDALGLQIWTWHKSIKTVLIYNTGKSKLYRTMIERAK